MKIRFRYTCVDSEFLFFLSFPNNRIIVNSTIYIYLLQLLIWLKLVWTPFRIAWVLLFGLRSIFGVLYCMLFSVFPHSHDIFLYPLCYKICFTNVLKSSYFKQSQAYMTVLVTAQYSRCDTDILYMHCIFEGYTWLEFF